MALIHAEITGGAELHQRLLALGDDAPRALTRALNRTLTTARVSVRRLLAEDTGLKQGTIDRSLEATKATFSRQEARLAVGPYRDALGRMSKGGRIPLIEFRARGPQPSRGRGQGVRYALPGGRGLAPSAFIATMGSGHLGVFRRRIAAGPPSPRRRGRRAATLTMVPRLPIDELFGPSLSHVMHAKVLNVVLPQLEDVLERNLEREIAFWETRRSLGSESAA